MFFRHRPEARIAGMEKVLIRLYRRALPGRLQRRIPSHSKDRLQRVFRFARARPGPGVWWLWLRASLQQWRGASAQALALWDKMAARWQGHPPALVRAGQRRALLALSATAPDNTSRAALLNRVLLDLAGPHELKTDTQLIDCLRDYVAAALPDGTIKATTTPPRSIVICLDILKITARYTHARAVFAICNNLLHADPQLRIDLVISNERLVAGTEAIAPDKAALNASAQEAMASFFGARFFLHVLEERRLEGIVSGCRKILELAPDLVLFGGGHRGPVSNESRVLRHCLFPHLPVAFFFFQANDQVDDRADLIIARGPHRIEGYPQKAAVRVQPYPTLPHLASPSLVQNNPDGPSVIVSAIAGARMEAKLEELGQRKLNRFLELLDTRPGTIWHFIGAEDPARMIAGNRALRTRVSRGQVIVHPVLPADAFTELAQAARLFLHFPGFTGGSGGAGIARRAGVPILAFDHSDVAGRQPPETVFDEDADVAPCLTLASQILTDDACAQRIIAAQDEYSAWLRAHAADRFLECLAEACVIGCKRL